MGRAKWNEALIASRIADGRGTGTGEGYRPWLEVSDLSSSGVSSRVWGHKTQREHHLFSKVELNLFYCLEWATDITDIREQFPISRELTQGVAESLNIRHPYYPGSRVPTVMTVDFLVTRQRQGQEVYEAFNAKVEAEAEDDRSLHKLVIQQEACALMGFHHYLILDTAIPKQIASNISWLRDALPRSTDLGVRPGYFEDLKRLMQESLATYRPNQTLQSYCDTFDAQFGLPQGLGLRVARILIYERLLKIDMECVDIPSAPLDMFALARTVPKLYAVGAA